MFTLRRAPAGAPRQARQTLFCVRPLRRSAFIRREAGQRRLEAAVEAMRRLPRAAQQRPMALARIRQLVAEVQELAATVKQLEQRRGFFSEDRDLNRQVAALKGRKQAALAELEAECKANGAKNGGQ